MWIHSSRGEYLPFWLFSPPLDPPMSWGPRSRVAGQSKGGYRRRDRGGRREAISFTTGKLLFSYHFTVWNDGLRSKSVVWTRWRRVGNYPYCHPFCIHRRGGASLSTLDDAFCNRHSCGVEKNQCVITPWFMTIWRTYIMRKGVTFIIADQTVSSHRSSTAFFKAYGLRYLTM